MNPVQNEKGEWVIPASRRPDGTWRKEKLLKEGYVPQDEVRAFETRASKQVVKKGIPGLPPAPEKPKAKPAEPKKKGDVKPAVAAVTVPTASLEKLSVSGAPSAAMHVPADDVDKDPKKRLKALKKKLRDIVELQTKNVADLSVEQREKLGKKESIEAEIVSLANFDK